jgi:DNA-binding transcriptional LysR family regulator
MARVRLRHMQALVAVAELGSVGRAAQRMALTQPAVTQAISELERLLECQLFERHGKGTKLTKLGEELFPHIKDALSCIETGVERLFMFHNASVGTVRVAAIEGAINGLLERALPVFNVSHPTISVELDEVTATRAGSVLSEGQADLLLVREPPVLPEGWDFSELLQDELVVVAGAQHPMVDEKRISIDRLRTQKWILLPLTTEARQRFDALLLNTNGRNNAYFQLKTRSFSVIQSVLQNNPLLMLAPLSIVRQRLHNGQMKRLDVELSLPLSPIGVLSQQSCGAAASALRDFIIDFAHSHP